MKETAIYIHIPFCDHKCIYCDFYSIISYENTSSYLSSLKKEIEFYSKHYSDNRKIISIFFGGGTPSFMEPDYIREIIETVKSNFNVTDNAEITMETNPGTVTKAKLIQFRNSGINRISIGIQSFNDAELKFLTRIHNSETAIKTVHYASEAGFENISIDLIFNLPKQTKEIWRKNMETAIQLPIKHISTYSLILEPGTILNKMVIDGKVKMQSEDYDADLYEETISFLTENGFKQYEVSNFTKPGYECVQNNAYWRYKDYIGFGTSAHSFVEGKRWWNFSSVKFYNEAIEQKQNAVAGSENITDEQMLEEYIMLALRSSGLDCNELAQKFGDNWLTNNRDYLNELIEHQFLIIKNNLYILTPKGYAMCDELLLKFQ
ncbi:MAG: radical SAM family heme chaperone HemW [Melioribacteraceae bacterium]|jgi:oxygen-independent coproporphyrinogen-3 oxidase|nr:radical SAM family heme chaperone HemW [Melioribacteraceae bacterium]